uniref:Uncharacterized protein n=1 Tax=Carnobacterium maltaromaticum TaxID=2751 RepID=A0A1Z5AZ54_CARML|nr:hypothetical protein [Carnobacterium maltaromaticum]CRI06733.1 protein of unknown function [Carnobacterium maltaromaticum]
MPTLNDSKRINRVLSNNGINISTEQANELWSYYSNCLYAVWLGLPESDNDLLQEILESTKIQKKGWLADERPNFLDAISIKLSNKSI